MKDVHACIVCNSKELVALKAAVHPFIAERIWKKPPFELDLLICKRCGFIFFDPRPSNDELSVLYAGYRGVAYQQARQKHEKEYTPEFNRMLGDCHLNAHRKTMLSSIIQENTDTSKIHSVLDYGGDRGQFIPPDFSDAEKYVFEISGLKPISGVKSIMKLSESKHRKFDFIMCCHLLEHVPYPSQIIRNIKRFAQKDTIFYFEVPYEIPVAMPDAIKFGNPKLAAFPIIMRVPQLYNCVVALRPALCIKMHEHINFFF